MLRGKNIILGVTGGIAAYKAAILIRLLKKQGANVKVIMTPLAKEFITPLTLATLSKNPILVDFFNPENGDWNSHVDLGQWADMYIIAPATANTMARMAHGIADNLLLTTYLSARCPVVVAPAMDLDMYRHPTTQANLSILKGHGVYIVEPAEGELASGLEGKGRMAEPETILEHIQAVVSQGQSLKGVKVMVTSGPTIEPIDPVRYIGNHSSGKMGNCLAMELAQRGAQVLFITGPVHALPIHKSIEVVQVSTADQMYNQATKHFKGCNAAILAAAVADYKPQSPAKDKIKRSKDPLSIVLEPTQDIAQALGASKGKGQLLVGFALETTQGVENATSKLSAKNLDLIVLNSLSDEGAGFGVDTNRVTIIGKDGRQTPYPKKTKEQVAVDIINEFEQALAAL